METHLNKNLINEQNILDERVDRRRLFYFNFFFVLLHTISGVFGGHQYSNYLLYVYINVLNVYI